jgi:hypothetical protein
VSFSSKNQSGFSLHLSKSVDIPADKDENAFLNETAADFYMQFVTMFETYEKAEKVRADMNKQFAPVQQGPVTVAPQQAQFPNNFGPGPMVQQQGNLGTCDKCGAPNKLSKAGNKYCGAVCFKK